jgi:PEP-CTERM motif
MRAFLYGATAAALLVSSPALAVVNNLVNNGSFESGLAGWTIGGSDGQNFPPVAIFYNNASAYPIGAFGEAVPPDNSVSLSPDAVGNRAAYFVTDLARAQSLSQTLFLTPGRYEFGFSAFAPQNGYNNAGDARFRATILGTTVANYLVSSGPVRTWQAFTGQTTIQTAGLYTVNFQFDTNLVPSKDVVIDRVYVAAVPEPASWAMMIAGFGLVGLMRRRASRASVAGA